MRYRSVFDIIGPSMVGPSSSHTAGANRIGQLARQFFGETPKQAKISFYGSFAETYQGHGTDKAIIAGLLGLKTDDLAIRDSFALAHTAGLDFSFHRAVAEGIHPNSVRIQMQGLAVRELNVMGISIGGGSIEIIELDGYNVRVSGDYPVLMMTHTDQIGVVQSIGRILAEHEINVSHMEVDRKQRGGEAIAVVEMDRMVPEAVLSQLRGILAVRTVTQLEAV